MRETLYYGWSPNGSITGIVNEKELSERVTCSCEVKLSIPDPPEAKLTPVGRSSVLKLLSRYAGNVALIPKASATQCKH